METSFKFRADRYFSSARQARPTRPSKSPSRRSYAVSSSVRKSFP